MESWGLRHDAHRWGSRNGWRGAAGMAESWGLLNQSSAEADSGGVVGYDGGG